MSDLKELKKRIYEDERIEELLEKLGCEHVKPEKNYELFTASRPDGNNRRSVQVYNTESLTSYVRSKSVKGDIFTIVSFIRYGFTTDEDLNKDLFNSKKWICENLGYQEFLDGKPKQKTEVNSWLKDIKKKRKKVKTVEDVEPNKVLDESVVNQFVMYPYWDWVHEGISWETQKEFEVGFCLNSRRVVMMIRNKYGELIGVKGRTVDPDFDDKEEPKYLYLYKCNKSIEFYNLHRALPHILERKQVLVFEAEKSCMKAHQYGYPNAIAVCGDGITQVQVSILKDLGIDVEIILCYDKDKDKKYIIEQAEKLTNRKVSSVFDTKNLLDAKDSPVDKGQQVWETLYNKIYRIPVESIIPI